MSAQDFDGSAGLPDGVKPAGSARPQEILNAIVKALTLQFNPRQVMSGTAL